MLDNANPSGIQPVGGHLVVLIEKGETEKRAAASGLYIPDNTAERDKLALNTGMIVAACPYARWGLADAAGKRAVFGRYAGAGAVIKGADGEDYRMLFDEDVKGTTDG